MSTCSLSGFHSMCIATKVDLHSCPCRVRPFGKFGKGRVGVALIHICSVGTQGLKRVVLPKCCVI